MPKLNYAQNSSELEQQAQTRKRLLDLGLSNPAKTKITQPSFTDLQNPRQVAAPTMPSDMVNQPLLVGDKTDYQFKTNAETQGFQPVTIGNTQMFKGTSAAGNPSYGDKGFVDQLALGNPRAGVSKPLPELNLPLSRVTQPMASQPVMQNQQLRNYLPNPRSNVDSTQVHDSIARALSAFNRDMSDGGNRVNAKYQGNLLSTLLGNDVANQSIAQRGNESAQSNDQFAQTQQQRNADRQQASQLNQFNQDLNARRLSLDEQRFLVDSQPRPVVQKQPQPELKETGTDENGNKSFALYDPVTQQFSPVKKSPELVNQEGYNQRLQQIKQNITDPAAQAQAIAELDAAMAKSKRAK